MHSRKQYLEEVGKEYATAEKARRSELLDEAEGRTKLNRKYLIRVLGGVHSGRRFWCKQAVIGDDDRMQAFVPVDALFKGRHFDGQIIILCVSWYTSFKLSLRDLVIMMADRGISLTHTTILRWVQCYLPEFEKRWSRYARPVGGSWRMDETYIRVGGRWVCLYRAVDKSGRTVDFFLSRNRDVNAAKTFLRSAMKNTRKPTKITLDAFYEKVVKVKADVAAILNFFGACDHPRPRLPEPPINSEKLAGDPQGGGSPSCGGSRQHRCVPAPFAGA